MSFFWYFVIGSMFSLLVDIASNLAGQNPFNTLERVICMLAWPITLPIFVIAAIKEYFKNK